MSDFTHTEVACRLLRQTHARLAGMAISDSEKLNFEDVYSNGLIEFAGKQEILWAIVFDGETADGRPSIASHLRNSISKMASKNAKQLVDVHRALSDVYPVLYLKGACLIVENEFLPAPWRSMTDIDFLVPRDRLEAVLEALYGIGYRTNGEKYTEALHAHYPMLKKDGFEVGLEVHTRCFRWPTKDLLDPEQMRDDAVTVRSRHEPVQIPQINDRIIHLIVHAQIASNRYARREFLMRDALEFRVLCSREGADLESIREKFGSAGYENHFLSFVGFADRIMHTNSIDASGLRPCDIKWVNDAWVGLQYPKSLAGFRRVDVAKNMLSSALMPSRWGAIAQALTDGDELRDLVQRVSQAFVRK